MLPLQTRPPSGVPTGSSSLLPPKRHSLTWVLPKPSSLPGNPSLGVATATSLNLRFFWGSDSLLAVSASFHFQGVSALGDLSLFEGSSLLASLLVVSAFLACVSLGGLSLTASLTRRIPPMSLYTYGHMAPYSASQTFLGIPFNTF